MKKKIRLFNTILLIQIVFISCSTSQKGTKNEYVNCSNLDSIKLVINQNLMNEYIEYIEENNLAFPLFGIKTINAVQYQDKIEELKHYRNIFVEQDNKLRKILEQDYEYSELQKANASKQEKQKVYKRLWSTDSNYRNARIIRDMSLNKSNLMTLKYIYNEYKSENKIFPTDFISEEIKELIQKHQDIELKRKYEIIKIKCEEQ